MQATGARVQLQDAILRSHGSHTARWLTETAAECLKHGLLTSNTGLQLHPIRFSLVDTHLKVVLPEFHDIVGKLQSATGLKYFRLFWASQQPDTVLLRLREIISNPGQTPALTNLLRSIQIVDKHIAAPVNGQVPSILPPGVQAPTNKDAAATATHRFSVGLLAAVFVQSLAWHNLFTGPCLHSRLFSALHTGTFWCNTTQTTETIMLEQDFMLFAQQTHSAQHYAAFCGTSYVGVDPHCTPKRLTLQCMQVADALSHLKAAVARSHPPTAKYLVETAVACLDHGLQLGDATFQLRPVSWVLVADVVSQHCPHAELLEKMCGRVGQKYFQLLGNTDDGLPEFVLADIHALAPGRQSPAVTHILSQMQDRSQPQPQQTHTDMPDAGRQPNSKVGTPPTAKTEATGNKQPTITGAAGPKLGTTQGANSSWDDPPPGFAPLSSRGNAPADKPVPTVARPNGSANSTASGSSQAMQALLSACMQHPPAKDKDSGSAPLKLAPPAAQQTKPFPSNMVNTNGMPDVNAARASLPGKPLPSKPLPDMAAPPAQAEALNGIGSKPQEQTHAGSSPSSSASGVTEAMQARSAASTEPSALSPHADDRTVIGGSGQQGIPLQDPFCIDCMAHPGHCGRHPLIPTPSPDGPEMEGASLEAAAGSSQCSSQVSLLHHQAAPCCPCERHQ